MDEAGRRRSLEWSEKKMKKIKGKKKKTTKKTLPIPAGI
jgi:hypothetical protein